MKNFIVIVGVVAVVAVIVAGSVFFARDHWQNVRIPAPTGSGATVAVLIDFSRSFVRTDTPSRGLSTPDQTALRTVANAIADMYAKWNDVKVVWLPIQDSAVMKPLCGPIMMTRPWISQETGNGTPSQLRTVLQNCVNKIVAASADDSKLSGRTDISAAIDNASTFLTGKYPEKLIFAISDFNEDLPRGHAPAQLDLKGEQIVMIHRPGTDERPGVAAYLRRISDWKATLTARGAKPVSTVPVLAASSARLAAAVSPRSNRTGTARTDAALTILVDSSDQTFDQHALINIGTTLSKVAASWPSLVITAQWVMMRPIGVAHLPPTDFTHVFIPDTSPGVISTPEAFEKAMNELAKRMPVWELNGGPADIAETLALVNGFDPPLNNRNLVIISDFKEAIENTPLPIDLGSDGRVMMIWNRAATDGDANPANARLNRWKNRLGITRAVCSVRLESIADDDSKAFECLAH